MPADQHTESRIPVAPLYAEDKVVSGILAEAAESA